jgi:signal transduction histidine kinase
MAEQPHGQIGADILIADDNAANREVLAAMLTLGGYRVRSAASGALAIGAARDQAPDLILLDTMMPDMDGYEVCRRLKQSPELRDVPVIFISPLAEVADKVKAFGAGAVDYVATPFQFEEVQARVETHLKIRRLQQALKAQYDQLQQSFDRLRELEGLRDSLTHMIVHDLRTPLTSVVTGLETLQALGELDEMRQQILGIAVEGGETLLGMISDLLDISKTEDGSLKLHREPVDAAARAAQCLQQVAALAADRGLRLSAQVEEGLPPLVADREKLRRVIVNLLGNALRFTPEGSVTLSVARDPDGAGLRFAVIDTGEGIPEEAFARIFDKFGQVESHRAGRKTSTGLGLTFCKMAVEAHGGRIWVESRLGEGSTFAFTIPLEHA